MNSIDKIKIISNFKDKKNTLPQIQVNYIDFVYETEEERLKKKMERRNIAIDVVLDEVNEEDLVDIVTNQKLRDELSSGGLHERHPVIAPQIHSMNIQSKKFISEDILYDEIIDFIDKSNLNSHIPINLDLTLSNSNDGSDNRKFISKVLMASNLIATEGRIGPAKTVILGKNVFYKMSDCLDMLSNSGLQHFVDYTIDPDKVIVCRINNTDQPGIICIFDEGNGRYFLKETKNWFRQYCSFKVI